MNVKSLVPLIRVLKDFGNVLIYDDSRDIMLGGRFHHYQVGGIIVGAAEMAERLLAMGDRVLAQEQQMNRELRMLHSQVVTRHQYRQHENEEQARQRAQLMKQYYSLLMKETEDPNSVIYAGNLNNIRVQPGYSQQGIQPRAQRQTKYPYGRPALPATTLDPPGAPD